MPLGFPPPRALASGGKGRPSDPGLNPGEAEAGVGPGSQGSDVSNQNAGMSVLITESYQLIPDPPPRPLPTAPLRYAGEGELRGRFFRSGSQDESDWRRLDPLIARTVR